jgi:hypothetical protein
MVHGTLLQSGGAGGVELLGILVLSVLFWAIPLAGIWKSLEKADQPGWGALVPFYNLYLLSRVGGVSLVWVLVTLIPYIGVVGYLKITINVATAFGKGRLYGLGVAVFPWVGWPALGFGSAQHG